MSEYWVSKDKYFCKYCNIFIADDKPSRNLHETGLRHKGNYERFIRDIYKRGAKDQRDKADEAREMERINAAANAAMSADGFASTSTLPPPRARPAPAPASSDPYANYSTAESLGYIDPDADKVVAELAEVEARKSEGRIGEWQRIVKPAPKPKPAAAAIKAEEQDQEEPTEVEEPPVRRKGYLGEETRQLSDDLAFDPTKVGFRLKRQRLTLKEEDDLRQAEEYSARVKKEAERRERKERKAAGLDKSGWAEVAHEEGGNMLLFLEEEIKPEDLGPGVDEAKPDVKPVAAPTFKKRKQHGAMRSKV